LAKKEKAPWLAPQIELDLVEQSRKKPKTKPVKSQLKNGKIKSVKMAWLLITPPNEEPKNQCQKKPWKVRKNWKNRAWQISRIVENSEQKTEPNLKRLRAKIPKNQKPNQASRPSRENRAREAQNRTDLKKTKWRKIRQEKAPCSACGGMKTAHRKAV